MAILISSHLLKKSFGARPLFEGLTFAIETGERIGLIGPNGAGKSTLLRILAGKEKPDAGTLSVQKNLRIGYLEQVPQFAAGATVQETVLEGASAVDDWEYLARADEILSKLELSHLQSEKVENLSGGWKKKVALARELLRTPDLLLLDEPTNHLDVESIQWLEKLLSRASFAVLTITHDRVFLQNVSNRILELDKRNLNGLLSIQGDYQAYLATKQDLMDAQNIQEVRLKNTLRRETEWLRRGAKARTTKQQARIQRAEELQDTVAELNYRNQAKSVRLDFESEERSPKKLIVAQGVSKSYGAELIVPPMDVLITPKTRLGLLGPNGCGKSTLIRLLVKTEAPDTGQVMHADQLKIAYFEQNRETLDPKKTLLRTVCPTGDFVQFRGKPVHVRGYLERFLFTAGQMEMEVGKLSGGEQSRLLLSLLMLKECNLLVLDEPTNDLDLATLDILQDVLQEFNGAVILVTHDRYFLGQVTNQILAFDRDSSDKPRWTAFSDLFQWQEWKEESEKTSGKKIGKANASSSESKKSNSEKKRKLSYKELKELETMEAVILKKEENLEKLLNDSQLPEHQLNSKRLLELTQEMAKLQAEIDSLYARWAELEEVRKSTAE